MANTLTHKRKRIGQVYLSSKANETATNLVKQNGGTITGLAGTVLDHVIADMTPENFLQQLAAAQQAVREFNRK